MIRLAFVFLVVGSFFSIDEAFSHTVDAALELRELLIKTDNFQGEFSQKLQNDIGKTIQYFSGKLSLKKPDCFRWEITEPEYHLVISNGKKIWDYDRELSQVSVQQFSKAIAGTPVSFLLTQSEMLPKNFVVKKIVSNMGVCLQQSNQCFEIQPISQDSYFKKIRVGFRKSVLKELQLIDQIDQVSIIHFKNVQNNLVLTPKQFLFLPPKNVDIIEESE